MSLINQVLRDLDARHAAEEQRTLPNEVRPLPSAERGHPGRMAALVVLLLIIGAGAWGGWRYLTASSTSTPTPTPTSAPAPAPVAAVSPAAETPSLPTLIIAPPEPAAESPATPAPPEAAPTSAAPIPAEVSSLQMATTLRAPPVPAPPAARIEKQVHDDAHTRSDTAYRAALAAQRAGRSAEAVAGLHRALREEPQNANARQMLLSVLVEQRQWPEAEAILRDGLDLMPSNAGWAMALARIEVEQGRTDQAWATLQKYMAAGQGNADYQGFAGVLLQRLQRPAEAVGHYQAALRLKPDARWWAGLGLALDAAGHPDDAHEAFRRALAIGGLAPATATAIERRLK
jgi:MSHA biogenesis protein MshN